MLLLLSSIALASTPGDLQTYSTFQAVGVEWNVDGDADGDAEVSVRYRANGSGSWRDAMPLVRNLNQDMLAGSVLFLQPGTEYELELSFSDSDGTAETRTVSQATRSVPEKPDGGRVFHVSPGAGGDGSEENPFGSIDDAEAVAQPGDTFLLHGGDYGESPTFDGGGDEHAYVVWQGAGDGEALFQGLRVRADHLWIEGVTVLDQEYGLVTDDDPKDVVVSRCNFRNNDNAIVINDTGAAGWTIMDNTIVGTNDVSEGSLSGEGVLLGNTNDHVVMYNVISDVADGLSYPGRNVDILGNDIFDTSDDGLEIDLGGANVRMWGNRLHNSYHNAITLQPQVGAPWYVIRNQIIGFDQSAFKFREDVDRNVVVHNTFVAWDWVITVQGHDYMKSFSRNNLFISIDGGKLFDFQDGVADARTDLDYDGFDWAGYEYPFKLDGAQHADLASFAAASGQETHGVVIDAASCIPSLDVPGPAPTAVPSQHAELTDGCAAVDAGEVLPNLNEDFEGAAPDLGAYELGAALPHYGPRPEDDAPQDTGGIPDTGDRPDTAGTRDTSGALDETPDTDGDGTCGCTSGGEAALLLPLGLLGWTRRRRGSLA